MRYGTPLIAPPKRPDSTRLSPPRVDRQRILARYSVRELPATASELYQVFFPDVRCTASEAHSQIGRQTAAGFARFLQGNLSLGGEPTAAQRSIGDHGTRHPQTARSSTTISPPLCTTQTSSVSQSADVVLASLVSSGPRPQGGLQRCGLVPPNLRRCIMGPRR